MSETWAIDPNTGDYVMSGGSPVVETGLLTPAYLRLKTPRTRWLYAPDTSFGSDFYKQNLKRSTENINQLRVVAENALRPMVLDKRARDIEVAFSNQARHAVGYQVKILDAQGQIESLNLPPIGNGE
jgi:phage gp46-like protein